MKNKRNIVFLLAILCAGVLFFYPGNAHGEDGAAGGQVNTEGKITFYEVTESSEEPADSSADSSTDSSADSSSAEPVGSSSSAVVPGESSSSAAASGKLPNTGETVQNFGLIGSGILLLGAVFFWQQRRKKEEPKP